MYTCTCCKVNIELLCGFLWCLPLIIHSNWYLFIIFLMWCTALLFTCASCCALTGNESCCVATGTSFAIGFSIFVLVGTNRTNIAHPLGQICSTGTFHCQISNRNISSFWVCLFLLKTCFFCIFETKVNNWKWT